MKWKFHTRGGAASYTPLEQERQKAGNTGETGLKPDGRVELLRVDNQIKREMRSGLARAVVRPRGYGAKFIPAASPASRSPVPQNVCLFASQRTPRPYTHC